MGENKIQKEHMVDFSILLIFLGLLKMLSQDSSVNEVGKEGCPYFIDKGTEAQRIIM